MIDRVKERIKKRLSDEEINDDVMFCPNCGEKQQEDTVTENSCEKWNLQELHFYQCALL